MKSKFEFSRILSSIIACTMTASMLTSFPALADEAENYPYTIFAASNKEGAITINTVYSAGINGNMATNGTIASSGNFNLNGVKKEHTDEEIISISNKIKSQFFSGENVEKHFEDFSFEDVNVNIGNPWEVQGTLEISGNINLNSGIYALNNIELTGSVKNTGNSVVFSETGDINISTDNVNFSGLLYAPYGNITIDSDNINLNNAIIIGQTVTIDCQNANIGYNENMAQFIGTESENESVKDELQLYAFGSYNKENNSIDIEWYSNRDEGSFEILESDNNIEYFSVASTTENAYSYPISENFESKYFKVRMTVGEEIAESAAFIIKKSDYGYSSDFLDSDNDGLADIYEDMIGTDKNNPDTDDDGLTDYQEVYITGTDPLKYDSVIEGTSDADADSDGDGLSNAKEIELTTNPRVVDTDGDGLSDGDEVNIYGTDPLNPDSDNDGLDDEDEIIIGLDPLNPQTFGFPDSEYKTSQTVDAESVVFSEINDENNPYKISIEAKCTGALEKNLCANESAYKNIINDDILLGKSVDLFTENSCAFDSVMIKYEIKENIIQNTTNSSFENIEKFYIFKYFEDSNMLLPIKTCYDNENNIVYAETDELGTYCLIDKDEWLNTLSVEQQAIVDNEPKKVQRFSISRTNQKADIVFSVNISGKSSNYIGNSPSQNLEKIKKKIIDTAEKAFENQKDIRIAVIGFADNLGYEWGLVNRIGYRMKLSSGSEWASNISELQSLLSQLSIKPDTEFGIMECGMQDLVIPQYYLTSCIVPEFKFREDSEKHLIMFSPARNTALMTVNDLPRIAKIDTLVESLEEKNIHVSFCFDYGYRSEPFASAANNTGGIICSYLNEPIEDKIYKLIFGEDEKPEENLMYISAAGYKKMELKAPLKKDSSTDTDGDTLTDWNEVASDTPLITVNEDGSINLPTLGECLAYESQNGVKTYIKEGLDNFFNEHKNETLNALKAVRIVPILSDPTFIDTDYDGMLDKNDLYPLKPVFSARLENVDYSFDISFRMNYLNFFIEDNEIYNKELSVLGSVFSTLAYKDYMITLEKGKIIKNGTLETLYDELGIDDFEDYKLSDYYNDDDISEMYLGHKKISYKEETKEIFFVTVRGTDSTIEEWSSNFDVGAKTDDYWDRYNSYWRNENNHKGFDVAANRLYDEIISYTSIHSDPNTKKVIYIVGHSRGAAIANILGSEFEDNPSFDSFVYTYATPNTTTDPYKHIGNEKIEYSTIFNIVNKDDLVPELPLNKDNNEFGFKKYGTTFFKSVNEDSNEWRNFTGHFYNYNGNLYDTINAFNEIYDTREDLYSCTGEKNRTEKITTCMVSSKQEADEFIISKYGDRIGRYYRAIDYHIDGEYNNGDPILGDLKVYTVTIEQTPAFFMMVLAEMASEKCHNKDNGDSIVEYNKRGGMLGFSVAEKYKDAKQEFIHSALDSITFFDRLMVGGMVDAHNPGTYCYISKNLN